MTIKKRLDALSEKVASSSRPKRGIVRVCQNEKEIEQAEREFESLPEDTPFCVISPSDMSVPRHPLPKDEK